MWMRRSWSNWGLRLRKNHKPDTTKEVPMAVRGESQPFPFVHFLGKWALLFIFLRWTNYSCPSCHAVFRRDYWPDNVRLGPGQRICQNCGQTFDDQSREWTELSMFRKLRFLVSPPLVGLAGGFVLAAFLSVFVGPRDEHTWPVVFVISGFGLFPLVLWCSVRLIWVFRSIHRFKEANGHPDSGELGR
jgi:hypothetical protein